MKKMGLVIGLLFFFYICVINCYSADWPKYKRDTAHTGFNGAEAIIKPPLELKWSWSDGINIVAIESSPVIYQDKVFIGTIQSSNGTEIISFNLNTGERLWSYSFAPPSEDAGIYPTPVVHNGKIYVASWDGYFYCFDANRSLPFPPPMPLWRRQLTSPGMRSFRSSPLVQPFNNILYIATAESPIARLFALDSNNGNIINQFTFPEGYIIYSSLALYGNKLIIGLQKNNTDGMIMCLDVVSPNAIQEIWRYSFGLNEPVFSSPVIKDGVIYCVISKAMVNPPNETTLYCFDINTGNVISSYVLGETSGYAFSTPSIAYGNIYITTLTKLWCLHLNSILDNNPQTEPLRWVYELPANSYPYEFSGSSPAIANGMVYFEAGDMGGGAFYAVDANTGEEKFIFRGPPEYPDGGVGYCISSPAIAQGRVVFVSSHDFPWTGVYCFGSQDSSAPVLGAIGDKTVDENSNLSFTLTATDQDGDSLTYSASNLPQGATFNSATGEFIWTPSYTQAGTYSGVHFEVSDGKGGIDSEDITITVNNVNRAPSANSQSVITSEDTSKSVTLTASDPDGGTLTYSILTNPSHGILTGTVPSLTYVPAANYNGSDSFTLKARDTSLDSNTATISITVTPVNDAPILAAIGNKTVNEGSILQFTVSATDVDGDVLTYSASNLPAGATFLGQTFSWTPNFTHAGTFTVTFSVSDGKGGTDSETITITVNNVEQTPTAPTSLTTQALSSSSIKLTWLDNSTNETGFKVERSLYATTGFTQIATVGANIATYTNTGLTKNKTYYYRVRAYNSAGNSNYSNTASARTLRR